MMFDGFAPSVRPCAASPAASPVQHHPRYVTIRRHPPTEGRDPLACVIGGIDIVRPLGLAGIPSAVVAEEGDPVRYSRFTRALVDLAEPFAETDVLLERLFELGASFDERPVLFCGGDWDVSLVSHNRDRLGEVFRFALAEKTVIDDLLDKARFQQLAQRLDLPVPAGRRLSITNGAPPDCDLPFPVILKPLTRPTWNWADGAKALLAETPQQLAAHLQRLSEVGVEVLAQEVIPGPETLVESYHAYIDEAGETVGEFTGRKIRTHPRAYGYSTAVEITDQADVARAGRDALERVSLRGVAKVDFKRGPDGRLRLLEINPRFSLWHHPGARAGVNLPALVYADLAGWPRPLTPRARPGIRWCAPRTDDRPARAAGIPRLRWLAWTLSCETRSGVAFDDPRPLLHILSAKVSREARSLLARRRRPA